MVTMNVKCKKCKIKHKNQKMKKITGELAILEDFLK